MVSPSSNARFYSPPGQAFDVVEVEDQMYPMAIFSKPIEHPEFLTLDMADYNVIILAPITTRVLLINAVSVVALANLHVQDNLTINATEVLAILDNSVNRLAMNTLRADEIISLKYTKTQIAGILAKFNEGIEEKSGFIILKAFSRLFRRVIRPPDS